MTTATQSNFKVITSVIAFGERVGSPIITRTRAETPAKALAESLKEHRTAGATEVGFDSLENGSRCPFNGTAYFANGIEFFVAVEVDNAPQDKLTGLAVGNDKAWMKLKPQAAVNGEDLDNLLG